MFNNHLQIICIIFFFILSISNDIFPQDKKGSEYYYNTFGLVSVYKTQSSPSTLIKGDYNDDGRDDISVLSEDQLRLFYQKRDSIGFDVSVINFSNHISMGAFSKLKKDKLSIFILATADPDELQSYSTLKLSKKIILWRTNLQEEFENIVLNDLNGDKRTDIILFGRKQLGITYYRGNGDGTFQNPIQLFTDYSFNNVSISTLHDSESPDFVGSSWLTDQILIFANDGMLKFSPPLIINAAGEPEKIITADINKDLYIDLITFNKRENKIILFNGELGGGFLPKENRLIPCIPSKIEIADCNNDGVKDFIIGSSVSKTAEILLCDINGNFVEDIHYDGGESTSDMMVFRNKKSSFSNLAILDQLNCELKILYNAAIQQNNFKNIAYAVGVEPTSLYVEDLNNNGLADVIVSNKKSKSLSLFINSTESGLKGQIAFDMSGHPSTLNICRNKDNNVVIVSSDIDDPKILISEINISSFSSKTSSFSTQHKSFVLNTISGTKTEPLRIFCLQEISKNEPVSFVLYERLKRERFIEKVMNPVPCEILKGVIFADNNKNVIYASRLHSQNKIELYRTIFTGDDELSNGKKMFTIDSIKNCPLKLYSVRLNHDDLDDLVVSLGEPENKLYIFYGMKEYSSGSSQNQGNIILTNIESANIQFYDLDNNGIKDIIYLNKITKTIDVRFVENNGAISNVGQITTAVGISDFRFADLNNDGSPELLLTDFENGLLKIIRMKD
ncbi:MAG: hypothetical protein C0417_05760 [Chlorobiaceae bacterium]|nr:hypothetical protein [Chlorobiaceae bacterium]